MKLLFVMNSAHYFVLNRLPLAITAKKAGYDVYIAAQCDDAESVRRIESEGITYLPFNIHRKGLKPLSTLSSYRQLSNIFNEIQPDIVHGYTIKALVLSGILCRHRNIPFVGLIAGSGMAFNSKGLQGWILKQIAKNLYRYVFRSRQSVSCFQNRDDQRELMSLGICTKEQTQLVGSGVNTQRFSFLSYNTVCNSSRSVLLAARMLRNKGITEYLLASQVVRLRHPNTEFKMVGAPDTGNPNSFSPKELEILCQESNVQWLGHTNDMPGALRECDIFCMPTYYPEGIPMALLQAASMGKPLIVTDVPGCREVVKDQETGLLIPPRDPEALAKAIIQLLESPQLCSTLSSSVREHIEGCHREELHHERYLSIYRTLIKETRSVFPSPSSCASI
ncbi:hypothetical protein SCG7086_BM_00050 [Chlamydiales bacterium SCGC AG-110-P3]|nr:hypothetical protein SCG7086_BM_00050 [Chlamydiales bacterium SCGC AG-110-P3]